ncbi:MAG TPA: LamG domain-containing protein [Thermoanaerobaculia bacterium]|nr:LamG domain-containing protein [Thermoanaerobaculia bacterium]
MRMVAVLVLAASLQFQRNEPRQYDFADQAVLPPTFGAGEFTFELWIKPDASFPVGPTDRGTIDQLKNWSESDRRPYSAPGWWYEGNWLLDGHSRPAGFGGTDSRAGTFSLQFFGGGRLRWMFADDDRIVPVGMVWTVQPAPAKNAPSLLDGQWHRIACVRRWTGESGADLELWIDGALVAKTSIPQRVNMRRFWDSVPHPNDPKELGGWAWGAEVMTAWDFYFTQYEDYKGLLDDLRFYDRAKTPAELAAPAGDRGLVGHFAFDEGTGTIARDRLDPNRTITLRGVRWSGEDAPR